MENEIQKSLDSYITAEMDDWDFSGVVRIIQNGRILYETCRGYSNIEFGIKNTMETRFTVASVTKQFTAFAIMILVLVSKWVGKVIWPVNQILLRPYCYGSNRCQSPSAPHLSTV